MLRLCSGQQLPVTGCYYSISRHQLLNTSAPQPYKQEPRTGSGGAALSPGRSRCPVRPPRAARRCGGAGARRVPVGAAARRGPSARRAAAGRVITRSGGFVCGTARETPGAVASVRTSLPPGSDVAREVSDSRRGGRSGGGLPRAARSLLCPSPAHLTSRVSVTVLHYFCPGPHVCGQISSHGAPGPFSDSLALCPVTSWWPGCPSLGNTAGPQTLRLRHHSAVPGLQLKALSTNIRFRFRRKAVLQLAELGPGPGDGADRGPGVAATQPRPIAGVCPPRLTCRLLGALERRFPCV